MLGGRQAAIWRLLLHARTQRPSYCTLKDQGAEMTLQTGPVRNELKLTEPSLI